MNTKYVNGSWRQSNFNTVMLSKKHVAMLVSKNQSERQLNISSKCTFCYSVKKKIKATVMATMEFFHL